VGDGTFTTLGFVSGFTPTYVVTGDFNGDGKADLIAAIWQSQSTGMARVYLGNGDGTFNAGPTFALNPGPDSLTAADFNGDGKLDFAVANNDGTISVFAGNGNGTFENPVTYGMGAASPLSRIAITSADINGDGITDLVTASGVLLGDTAARLKFTTQPTGAPAGGVIPPFAVQVQDAGGIGVQAPAAIVTVTSNPAGVSSSTTPVSGVATFSNVGFPTPGAYTFAASSPGLTSATSNSFTITGSGAALPSVVIEGPQPGAMVSGIIVVSGWALDNIQNAGSAISSVQVKVDGTAVGNAVYGIGRPDVCATYPGRPGCPNVGFTFALDTSNWMPGNHTITVTATDTDAVPDSGSALVG
jgi:hypothetical protein